MRPIVLCAVGLALAAAAPAAADTNVITLAGGGGVGGYREGLGTDSLFNSPASMDLDGDGNIYVADEYNKRIRKITPDGQTSLVAGNDSGQTGDGQGAHASFNNPTGVKVGDDGNLYVADYQAGLVRKIDNKGNVTTIKGGYYNQPRDVAVDHRGNLFIAEGASGWIERTDQKGARKQLVTGLREPMGIDVDGQGNLYVSDYGSEQLRKVLPSGRSYVLAGQGKYGDFDGGPGIATLSRPTGVSVDAAGCVYFGDRGNHRIRRVNPYGVVDTIAGTSEGYVDGAGSQARFDEPIGVATDGKGTVYVGDSKNYAIRKISGVTPCPADEPVERSQQATADALRNGISARCAANQASRCSFALRFGGKTVGRGRVSLSFSGQTFTHVAFSKAAKKQIKRAKTGDVTLSATVADDSGSRPSYRGVITLTG